MSAITVIQPPRPQCDAVAVARRRIGNVDYAVMSNGQMIRHAPLKPWNSKAERKQVLKQRRERQNPNDTTTIIGGRKYQ